jgi:hypothetical protein
LQAKEKAKKLVEEDEFVRIHNPEVEISNRQLVKDEDENRRQIQHNTILSNKIEFEQVREREFIYIRDHNLVTMMHQDYGDKLFHILKIWQAFFSLVYTNNREFSNYSYQIQTYLYMGSLQLCVTHITFYHKQPNQLRVVNPCGFPTYFSLQYTTLLS